MDEERMELELQHVEDVFWMRHDAGDVHVAGEMWEEVVVEAAEWLLQQWRTSRVALQQTLPLAVFHMFDSATRLEMEFRTFVLAFGRDESKLKGSLPSLIFLDDDNEDDDNPRKELLRIVGCMAAAEAAPTVVPTKQTPVKEIIPQVDASSVPKNDGAKVYKILEYLRKVPMHQADVSNELRRGDAVRIGDHWLRVSAAVKTSSSARPAPFAGMASKSVSSTRDPNVSKKIRYVLKFDHEHLPLDAAFPDAKGRDLSNSDKWDQLPKRGPKFQMVKHGCSNDIRQLWKDTLRNWPVDRAEFEKKLVQAGLTTQAKLDATRRQIKRRKKEDKKPRMRKQREIKISNQHLIGTELGEILAKGGDEQFTLGAVKFEKQ
ncbi:hypothetical protein P43SY_006453 [Pythium insidiosum]|uniref:Uncharacterized protein n=1 Tax=Pythium insidiosum TaxID=114742 RepID=A0AAD5LSZ5_PYTIN|nr:hypothetical protein P43SY_006453 [Pythium insidiosum]